MGPPVSMGPGGPTPAGPATPAPADAATAASASTGEVVRPPSAGAVPLAEEAPEDPFHDAEDGEEVAYAVDA
eukprot:2285052-Alexandrium_andersonii.AAC.1